MAAGAAAGAMGLDMGQARAAIDDLTFQIDARYDVLYNMMETAQLAATLNYGALMSSCIYCQQGPLFAAMSSEVCFHNSSPPFFSGRWCF